MSSDIERQRDQYLATDAAIERLEQYLADPANWPIEYPVTIRGALQRMREAERNFEMEVHAYADLKAYTRKLEAVYEAARRWADGPSWEQKEADEANMQLCVALTAVEEAVLTKVAD